MAEAAVSNGDGGGKKEQQPIRSVVVMVAMEGEAMPLIEKLGLERQANYFGHAAPFHCFSGPYRDEFKVAVVTNGKDKTYGCDNVRA